MAKTCNSALAMLVVVTLAAVGGCSGEDAPGDAGVAPESFIAFDPDFAGFQGWFQQTLPPNPLSQLVDPVGAHVGYLNRRPAPGTSSYPVGTILVKAIQRDSAPETWELFGMAKRGGGFNPDGATGWEYFLLRIGPTGNPYVTSRGLAPRDDGFDGGNGASYSPGGAAGGCNLCHGQSNYAASDHVISASLAPLATAEPR
jgi:hypothetical protein